VARCCLRPRGVDAALVISVPAAWPAPGEMGSARSQNCEFSELRFRFRATPFTSPHLLIFRVACASRLYTTGRLTKPYPGRPVFLADHSCSTGNHCQVTLTFSASHLPGLFRNPQPAPRNTHPATRNAQLPTRNAQLATRNAQLATRNSHPATRTSIKLTLFSST
jgi:hypothetical protein